MADALSLLWLPFLIAVVLVGIHTFLGLQVLARNIIFVDLALAQIAALGATLAFMLGHAVGSAGSYGWSLLFTLAAAMLLAATRGWSGRVPQEALIGVIYVVAASAAFLLVEKAPQGTEHIKQLLTGNILTAGAGDLYIVLPLYAFIGLALWAARSRLAEPVAGWRGWVGDFFFYACFGVVVTSSVALAGVLLVFSLLIVPATIGVLYCDGTRQLLLGWAVGIAACFAGLAISYAWDLSTGSAMVCTLGTALVLAGAIRPLLRGGTQSLARLVAGTRMGLAAFLILSGAWLAIAPRADQPLLDSIEYAAPGVRSLYMSRLELQIVGDAERHAERYRIEAERLNDREAGSRWQGAALSDLEVRRISSFLQMYSEMRKGEEYARREVSGRARERSRWIAGVAMIVCGLLLLPGGLWRGVFVRFAATRRRRS